MDKLIKSHARWISDLLNEDRADWSAILLYHRARVSFFCHERLVHLLVTLAFGIVFIVTSSIALIYTNVRLAFISGSLLILLVPYIIHYFKLENGVRELYRLDERLQTKLTSYGIKI